MCYMTDNFPLISIIVPCYKVEQYLPKCVDSILAQTYANLEIWLVDDGSPDSCGKICDEYAKHDSRIKVIHKENGGLSDARNVAIDKATGEWLTFIDSDDYVAHDYVKTLYELVCQHNCEMSVAGFQVIYDNVALKNEKDYHISVEIMDATCAVEKMFYQEKFDNMAWGKLYHKSLFESGIRFPKGLLFEDLATTYRLLFECKRVVVTSRKIYYYLLRPTSIEGSYSPRKVESMIEILKMMENNMKQLYVVKDAWVCRMFSFVLHIFLYTPKLAPNYTFMIKYIKKYRKEVLLNRNARKKARIAALLSYSGVSLLKCVFEFVNKRK